MKKLLFGLLVSVAAYPKINTPVCPLPLKTGIECTDCTIDQWQTKMGTLKEFPVQFSSLPNKKSYQAAILTLPVLLTELQKSADLFSKQMASSDLWLNKKTLTQVAPDIFTLNRSYTKPAVSIANFPFKPHARRLVVEPGTHLIIFGDLHGSVHSFVRDLQKLKKLGYLDNNWKITKKNCSIIFLGDYIDRGIYGVEVVYSLLRLFNANPEKVILVRGNHEDYLLMPDFKKKHTKLEEKDNAPSFIDELYRKFDITERDEVTLFRFYEILPVVLYIGCSHNGFTHYIHCCHGGLEIGYNPKSLLHAPTPVKYELIEQLTRRKNFDLLPKRLQDSIKTAFDLDVLCNDIRNFTPLAAYWRVPHTHHTAYVGFLWNDFYLQKELIVGQRTKQFAGWVYGKELTQELLSWPQSDTVKLNGIIRAHQHNNETGGPFLDLLCCGKGVFDVWKDGTVFTTISAPESKLDNSGQRCFTYDSFLLLIPEKDPAQWKLTHYYQDTALAQKEWVRESLNFHMSQKQVIPDKKP